MTASAVGARRSAQPDGERPAGAGRPLVVTGAIGAAAAAGTGLAVLTMLVLVGWIAAPHAAVRLTGLGGVLRAAAAIWLVGHHVAVTLHGAGHIGLLPLGLVLLPGALLWRAGRWVVRAGAVERLAHVGYAALALAAPYALVAGALAVASQSAPVAPSLPQAVLSAFLLALVAGGLGGARALAPWRELTALLPARLRSVIAATTGALAVLGAGGALLAAGSLAVHLGGFSDVNRMLQPGLIGAGLLLITQLGYLPNAVIWAVSFMLGPGFAFGSGTVVAPTGAAIGPLPALPLLAALPQGAHGSPPGWLSAAVLVIPYLAGAVGGLLLTRAAPPSALEVAPVWGFGCGVLTGGILAVLAAFAGGPLGDGRLTAIGPSPWQTGFAAVLEVGVAAAVVAGIGNWLRLRRESPGPAISRPADQAAAAGQPAGAAGQQHVASPPDAGEHTIYHDPWAGEGPPSRPPPARGPSALP
ncbi:MAG TPA: DUF6350 family protein [Streptosporangiaceae bacterium]